jgi:hypothetical protein
MHASRQIYGIGWALPFHLPLEQTIAWQNFSASQWADALIMKWTIMILKLGLIENESALDLPLSRQARAGSLGHPRATCYNPWFRCNRFLYHHEVFDGMQCTADKEVAPKIEGCDVIDRAILEPLDERSFSSLQDLAKRICIPLTMV